jgi:hypothetical protein
MMVLHGKQELFSKGVKRNKKEAFIINNNIKEPILEDLSSQAWHICCASALLGSGNKHPASMPT